MRTHKSKIIQKMLDDMEKDYWWVKLKRWYRLKLWILRCFLFNRNGGQNEL